MAKPLTEEDRALLKRVLRSLNESPALLWAGLLAGWFNEIVSADPADVPGLAKRRLVDTDALNLDQEASRVGPRGSDYRRAASIVRDLLK